MKKALVIDLSYQVHRYLAVPQMAALRTKDKARVGGIYGVLKAIVSALNNDVYSKVVCCMDSYPAFRKQLFPSYKSSRKSNPDSPEYKSFIEKDAYGWSQKRAQEFTFSTLQEMLPKLKIQTIIQENVEGDDLVYHTCKVLTDQGYTCTAMSDDRDYLQLIALIPTLKIFRVIKGDVVTKENFFDKIGVYPEWFIYYKAMMGDKSDEIPGVVKGFGEASIIKFVNEAHNQGMDTTAYDLFRHMFDLAKNYPDTKLAKKMSCLTEVAVKPLRKNLMLMDFRKCPYGDNKQEELEKLLSEPSTLDIPWVINKFKELEFNSLLTLPYEPVISRLV